MNPIRSASAAAAACLTLLAFLVTQGSSLPVRAAAYPGTVLLGRPTDHSVTVNAASTEPLEVWFEYGALAEGFAHRTSVLAAGPGQPAEAVLDGLPASASAVYRLRFRRPSQTEFDLGATQTFRTAAAAGQAFTFAIQADSHLDEQSSIPLYRRTLSNIAADEPDFLVDLGDTFFSEKLAKTYDEVVARHLLQRGLLDALCAQVPFFLTLGNHEGESGFNLRGTENIAVWATRVRKLYYPNPVPDAFYGGGTAEEPLVGQRESYYAWQWGDALFVVLDPYWYTTVKPNASRDNWNWTLGRMQYDWLKETLAGSRARYTFVFSHQLVGGVSTEGRGGIEGAPFYEWGGRNSDGSWGFDAHRPGWGKPIHQLFVDHGVTAWFHGHDHLFVKQDLDGIVYQEVPQPSHPGLGTQSATDPAYGYLHGDVVGGSGHLRVRVSPAGVTVEFVRAFLPADERNGLQNGEVAYRYAMTARDDPTAPTATAAAPSATAPRPTVAATAGRPSASPGPGPSTARLYLPWSGQ